MVDACLAYVDNPQVSLEDLLEIVPGPDFPTGGEIIGRTGARNALMTGRGSVVMRGKASVEEIRKDREAIVITAIYAIALSAFFVKFGSQFSNFQDCLRHATTAQEQRDCRDQFRNDFLSPSP